MVNYKMSFNGKKNKVALIIRATETFWNYMVNFARNWRILQIMVDNFTISGIIDIHGLVPLARTRVRGYW